MSIKKRDIKQEIVDLIGRYRSLKVDISCVNTMADIRKDLSTLFSSFGVEMGKAKRRQLQAEYNEEYKRGTLTIANYENVKNLERAKLYAKRSTGTGTPEKKALKVVAIEAEAEYEEYKSLVYPIREVLAELNQRIAHLRDELKQEAFNNANR